MQMDNLFSIIGHRLKVIEDLLQKIHSEELRSDAGQVTYLKVDKAAEFLSTTPNALRVMVNKNQIQYIKKQGKLFFRQSDLIEWLESGNSNENISSWILIEPSTFLPFCIEGNLAQLILLALWIESVLRMLNVTKLLQIHIKTYELVYKYHDQRLN